MLKNSKKVDVPRQELHTLLYEGDHYEKIGMATMETLEFCL
jgi:hypothetical protein